MLLAKQILSLTNAYQLGSLAFDTWEAILDVGCGFVDIDTGIQ